MLLFQRTSFLSAQYCTEWVKIPTLIQGNTFLVLPLPSSHNSARVLELWIKYNHNAKQRNISVWFQRSLEPHSVSSYFLRAVAFTAFTKLQTNLDLGSTFGATLDWGKSKTVFFLEDWQKKYYNHFFKMWNKLENFKHFLKITTD